MLCVIHRLDEPSMTHLRKTLRTEHLAHLDKYRDRILIAGPYLDPETGVDRGSMFLMNVESLAQARAFAEDDPYMRNGVFKELQVWEWVKRTGSLAIVG
jgi:uncharacterized protein YciI